MYRNSIGENEASINTLQMLTNIENRLEELFEKIEKMPPEKVEEAEKVRGKGEEGKREAEGRRMKDLEKEKERKRGGGERVCERKREFEPGKIDVKQNSG